LGVGSWARGLQPLRVNRHVWKSSEQKAKDRYWAVAPYDYNHNARNEY
jgi:hypothetical protein